MCGAGDARKLVIFCTCFLTQEMLVQLVNFEKSVPTVGSWLSPTGTVSFVGSSSTSDSRSVVIVVNFWIGSASLDDLIMAYMLLDLFARMSNNQWHNMIQCQNRPMSTCRGRLLKALFLVSWYDHILVLCTWWLCTCWQFLARLSQFPHHRR
jgi:hypothetical protein